MNLKKLFTIIWIGVALTTYGQNYPIQTTTLLTPPYSLYLSDYSSVSGSGLQLLLHLKELDRAEYRVKLRLTIEGEGIVIRTKANYNPTPILLQGGVPVMLSGADIGSYFNPNNLDFSGISRQEFLRSGALPEGFYTFKLEALDYYRGVTVSNPGMANAWLILNDPPLINIPFNNEKLIATDPQNITFSWTPRHTASPNAAFSTEYEFTLVELYPDNRNPNDAILAANPIYKTRLTTTALNYGLVEPLLIPGRKYAFRVRAYDLQGRDLFKNNGYSEVQVFQYGDVCVPPSGVEARALDPNRIKISWQAGEVHTGYVLQYKAADGNIWFEQKPYTPSAIVPGLAAGQSYQYRVRGTCGTIAGEYTEVATITTPQTPEDEFACGGEMPTFEMKTIPLPPGVLQIDDIITIADFEVSITSLQANADDSYKGEGHAFMPWLNMASAKVKFSRIRVNEDYRVYDGNITTVYSTNSRFVMDLTTPDDTMNEGEEGTNTPDQPDPNQHNITGTIDTVYVNPAGQIVVTTTTGDTQTITPTTDEAGNPQPTTITDSNGDSWTVDSEGNVSQGGSGEGNTEGTGTDQPDQREELIAEILQYLEQSITAWQDDITAVLPECIPTNNDLLNPVLEQINNYQNKLGELLSKFSSEDQTTLNDHVNTYNEVENPTSYQEALDEEDWLSISCRVYSYLNDLAQGVGAVADASAARAKLEGFISDYRAAYKQGSNSFTFSSTNFWDVYPTDYTIKGVSSIKVGLVDKRESDDYEPSLSLDYFLEDVTGQKEIAGTTFESSAVFQFGKQNWTFADPPKFMLYGYHSEVANGLDSKTLLEDYLPGKYDYEAVQGFINKIIDSHDKGEESLDMKGELEGQQVYARNIDFGDKGIYDLYISRTGDFKKDDNSFYSYSKKEVSEVFGFTGSFIQYRIVNSSEGITSITLPTSQIESFETSVLKLHSVSSGTAHIDLVNAIRAANLNAENKLDITEYGSDGGLSPVFEINHDGEKLKLMVGYPLLGNKKNKIDPSKRPEPVTGQTDNAMGKAGKWVLYEFENSKGTGTGHNTKIYVMAAQMELFESYLLIAQEVLITGINWRSQVDTYFSSFTCYSPTNQCCYQASKTIIEQFGVTTDRSKAIDVATLASETDYNTVIPTGSFETGLAYLEASIKANNKGGKPVLIGVHYNTGKEPYNHNKATYHYVVVVGKGYDRQERKHYYRYYEVGFKVDEKQKALSNENKLYVDPVSRKLTGTGARNKYYQVTEIRKNE